MPTIINTTAKQFKINLQNIRARILAHNFLIYVIFAIITIIAGYPFLAYAQSATSEALSSLDTLFTVIGLILIIFAVVIGLKKGRVAWKRVSLLFVIGLLLYLIGQFAGAYFS